MAGKQSLADTNTNTAPAADADAETVEMARAPAVNLAATSYDFGKLVAGATHAETLKTEKGRDKALVTAEQEARLAELPASQVAIPQGTQVVEVEDANGRMVKVPVATPAEEDEELPVETPVETVAE